MGLFNRKQKMTKEEAKEEYSVENQAFSGWRLEIPKDSNLPIVYNNQISGMIPFGYSGSTMDFPPLVEQSIYESAPSHSNCINLAVLSTMGAGYTFGDMDKKTLIERKDIEVFQNSVGKKFKVFLKEITKDYRLHNRINIKITKHTNGTHTYERISPAKIGYNKDKTLYYFSEDFLTMNYSKIYERYTKGCKPGIYMIDFDGMVDKYDPYPAPEWISAFKHININSKIPSYHESNMENSINPNLVISIPREFKNNKEKTNWFKALFSKKGVNETGSTFVFSANSKEFLPTVQQLEANKNDELFKVLRESTIDDICMAHNVNPALIGVKTPGSLGGSGNELETNWELFYNTVVIEMKEHIEDVILQLLNYSQLSTDFKLNDKRMFSITKTENKTTN